MEKNVLMKLVEQASKATPSQFIVNFEKLYYFIVEQDNVCHGKSGKERG